MDRWQASLGARVLENGRCQFRVWAPYAKQVELHLIDGDDTSGDDTGDDNERFLPMESDEHGYYTLTLDNLRADQRYKYRLNGDNEQPDPASRYQPEGVYGPSQVVDPAFNWTDTNWRGLPLQQYIYYELHIGTFSPEGTYTGAIGCLDELVDLGVTAVELMPVNQFAGERGWGYDGVFPFAVHNSYGTPNELKAFVDACHQRGIAVVLDVVYNHFGSEGNCFWCYGPYTIDHYKTPWGEALNFDGAHSDEVRAYFIENALYWIDEFHIDGLRLDAIHMIYDGTAITFLEELTDTVHQYAATAQRDIYLIAESDANDPGIVRSRERGGIDMDGIWLDDFHHSLHTLLTNERNAYYQDYGEFQHLVKALRKGFVYEGQYAPARKRRHGAPSEDVPVENFIVFVQNHDQIGNRMPNERAVDIFPFEALKLAFGLVLLSPYIPMLFMGDEYGETTEFEYFVDYQSPELIEAVRKGRRETFGMRLPDGQEPPDPQAEATFLRSKLNRQLRETPRGRVLLNLHRDLIRFRKSIPALRELYRHQMEIYDDEQHRVIGMSRWADASAVYAVFNFNEQPSTVVLPVPEGEWHVRMDSSAPCWNPDDSGDRDDRPDDGTNRPAQTSDGNLEFRLAPLSFILLERV